jgi:hypothetical protein
LTIKSRPVNARAARTAFIVASVPELVNRTRSTEATRVVKISASRVCASTAVA